MNRRWNRVTKQYGENLTVDAFLADIVEVCRRHRLSLAHEDREGAFIVEPLCPENIDWVFHAFDNVGVTCTSA